MQESTGDGRRTSLTAFIPSIIIIGFIIFILVKTFFSPVWAVILDTDGNYFKVRSLFICGNTIVYSRCSFTDKTRDNVLADNTGRFNLKIESIKNIKLIEMLPGEGIIARPDYPAEYFGEYRINVHGHDGTLVLRNEEGKIYGYVMFSSWGTGSAEYLKDISISGQNIYFTRSASTRGEAERLGTNHVFWQKFSGTYSSSGKKISGFFINERIQRHEWNAERR